MGGDASETRRMETQAFGNVYLRFHGEQYILGDLEVKTAKEREKKNNTQIHASVNWGEQQQKLKHITLQAIQ